jgi:hypothetical protein
MSLLLDFAIFKAVDLVFEVVSGLITVYSVMAGVRTVLDF